MTASLFDAYYFQHGCGQPYQRTAEWLAAFGRFADHIVAGLQPKTALDAGCAMGFLVEALRDRGVQAYGVDISEYALQQARADIRPYCWVGSVTTPLPQRYDVIVCIEVLEHMALAESEQAIANFCRYTDDVLFSSSPEDYREATHFNVQPPEYWAEQFARQGFVRDVDFDATFITPWAARYRRLRDPWPRAVRGYERRFWALWKENQELRHQVNENRQVVQSQQLSNSPDQAALVQTQAQEQEQELQNLRADLHRITHGPGWKLLQALAPLRPLYDAVMRRGPSNV